MLSIKRQSYFVIIISHFVITTPITTDAAGNDKPCQTKVGDFDDGVLTDKTVTAGEVAVYKPR